MPITLKLQGMKQKSQRQIFYKILILPCHVKSNQNIKNPDPLEALFKTLYFLFKCMFLPEVVTN
jgi:hypothetical protein